MELGWDSKYTEPAFQFTALFTRTQFNEAHRCTRLFFFSSSYFCLHAEYFFNRFSVNTLHHQFMDDHILERQLEEKCKH